jgi:citrate synthase
MLWGKKPGADSIRAMDVALILHAEHGFNASTFTARVIAATESDLYSAVTGAIGALKGPLHGGANTEVIHMLLEIGELEKVESFIAAKLPKKEKVMGMGHRVYKTTDPRAKVLFELSKKMGEQIGVTKWLAMSEKIQSIVHTQKGLYPNVDFYSASTYYTMGIDPEIYTLLFAVSRISGWSAHIIEQLSNNRLIRPRADYVGPRGLKYSKIEDRA